MRLSMQLYILITLIFLMVFVGNFLITMQNTKDYLKTEMTIKAKDTATSLGMILKNLISDKTDPEIELTINAISDSGFYKEIRLEDISYIINKDNIAKYLLLDKNDFQLKKLDIDSKIGIIEENDNEDLANQLSIINDEKNLSSTSAKKDKEQFIFYPSEQFNNQKNIDVEITYLIKNEEKTKKVSIILEKVLFKALRDEKFDNVPKWFIDMIHFDLEEQSSQINDGWRSVAVIYVSANSGIAYEKLYYQLKSNFIYSLITYIIAFICLAFLLRLILKPLRMIDKLSKKISQGYFEEIKELPWTIELKNVAKSMNHMSFKISQIISKLNRNIEDVNKKLHIDSLTQLETKQSFLDDMKKYFIDKSTGYVFLIKISNLTEFAATQGRVSVDNFIKDFAQILKNQKGTKSYRFFGSEFVLIAKDCDFTEATELSVCLKQQLLKLSNSYEKEEIFYLGGVPFDSYSSTADILSGNNEAYEMAKLIGPNEIFIKEKNEFCRGSFEWKEMVSWIIENKKVSLNYNSEIVQINTNNLIMKEVFAVVLNQKKEILPIGIFISVAQEQNKIIDFDKIVIQEIYNLNQIKQFEYSLIINISIESIVDVNFNHWLEDILKSNQSFSRKIIFSLASYNVKKYYSEFQNFIVLVKKYDARVMIKRFDTKFIAVNELKNLKPDMIRLPLDYTTDMENNKDKMELVDSICTITNILGIDVFAESMNNENDHVTLQRFGIKGIGNKSNTIKKEI